MGARGGPSSPSGRVRRGDSFAGSPTRIERSASYASASSPTLRKSASVSAADVAHGFDRAATPKKSKKSRKSKTTGDIETASDVSSVVDDGDGDVRIPSSFLRQSHSFARLSKENSRSRSPTAANNDASRSIFNRKESKSAMGSSSRSIDEHVTARSKTPREDVDFEFDTIYGQKSSDSAGIAGGFSVVNPNAAGMRRAVNSPPRQDSIPIKAPVVGSGVSGVSTNETTTNLPFPSAVGRTPSSSSLNNNSNHPPAKSSSHDELPRPLGTTSGSRDLIHQSSFESRGDTGAKSGPASSEWDDDISSLDSFEEAVIGMRKPSSPKKNTSAATSATKQASTEKHSPPRATSNGATGAEMMPTPTRQGSRRAPPAAPTGRGDGFAQGGDDAASVASGGNKVPFSRRPSKAGSTVSATEHALRAGSQSPPRPTAASAAASATATTTADVGVHMSSSIPDPPSSVATSSPNLGAMGRTPSRLFKRLESRHNSMESVVDSAGSSSTATGAGKAPHKGKSGAATTAAGAGKQSSKTPASSSAASATLTVTAPAATTTNTTTTTTTSAKAPSPESDAGSRYANARSLSFHSVFEGDASASSSSDAEE